MVQANLGTANFLPRSDLQPKPSLQNGTAGLNGDNLNLNKTFADKVVAVPFQVLDHVFLNVRVKIHALICVFSPGSRETHRLKDYNPTGRVRQILDPVGRSP